MKTAKEEFKHRFPETWESLTDKQKKHVIYVINGYALKQEQSTLSESKVIEVLEKNQTGERFNNDGGVHYSTINGVFQYSYSKVAQAISALSTVDIAQVGERSPCQPTPLLKNKSNYE